MSIYSELRLSSSFQFVDAQRQLLDGPRQERRQYDDASDAEKQGNAESDHYPSSGFSLGMNQN